MKLNFRSVFTKQLIAALALGLILILPSFVPTGRENLTVEQISYTSGSEEMAFFQVRNAAGVPMYYYRDIDQYPCNDSVCARMVLRLYWDIWGNFLKIGLADGQQLTKIGHQPFTDKDYERLHRLLNDPKCNLQYYKMDDLTDKESEHAYYNVDAVSAATVVNFTFDSVKGAVKTCYTLWKIVHGDIVAQIRKETAADLNEMMGNENLKKLVMLVETEKVGEDVLDSLNAELDLQQEAGFFSLIELNRKNPSSSKEFMEQLSLTLTQSGSVGEVASYNYLLLEKYMKKSVRNYELSLDYFESEL